MDGKISNKISFLSLIMIVGVIMYHSDLRYLSDYATILSMVIMPYFFAVSGFFAVRGLTRTNCFERIKKRVKTLLIPYILWNLVQVIYYLIVSNNYNRVGAKVDFFPAFTKVAFMGRVKRAALLIKGTG